MLLWLAGICFRSLVCLSCVHHTVGLIACGLLLTGMFWSRVATTDLGKGILGEGYPRRPHFANNGEGILPAICKAELARSNLYARDEVVLDKLQQARLSVSINKLSVPGTFACAFRSVQALLGVRSVSSVSVASTCANSSVDICHFVQVAAVCAKH